MQRFLTQISDLLSHDSTHDLHSIFNRSLVPREYCPHLVSEVYHTCIPNHALSANSLRELQAHLTTINYTPPDVVTEELEERNLLPALLTDNLHYLHRLSVHCEWVIMAAQEWLLLLSDPTNLILCTSQLTHSLPHPYSFHTLPL
uniref:Uncharacterized protein n=1 Tax=Lygus hesperus TaxID=30085 RepID=A0A0A9VUR0_LYGHE